MYENWQSEIEAEIDRLKREAQELQDEVPEECELQEQSELPPFTMIEME